MPSWIFRISIALAIALAPKAIQAEWIRQSPFPTENDLYACTLTDSSTGYAVGNYGTIVATNDAGATWTVRPSGSDGMLTSVKFLDAKLGWAIGGNGALLKTTDGGATWTNTAGLEFSYGSFNALSFPNRDTGWVVGAYLETRNRYILRTTDGGKTWEAQGPILDSLPTALNAVDFIDSRRGWAAGTLGLFSTLDAGETWTRIEPSISPRFDWQSINAMRFLTPSEGWMTVSADSGYKISWKLLRTRDGGLTWREQLGNDSGRIIRFQFLSRDTGFVAMGDSLLKTTNAGSNWIKVGKMPVAGAIGFLNDQQGLLVNQMKIFSTRDGGKTWRALHKGIADDLVAISFRGDSLGWVAGGHTIGHTRDGEHWETQWEDPGYFLTGLAFPTTRIGYAVGQTWSLDARAAVLKTIDGGGTWTSKIFPDAYGFTSTFFLNADFGWLSGALGVLLQTRDGGINWSAKPEIPERGGFYQMEFRDSLNGMGLGHASIWRTVDGGTRWTELPVIGPTVPGALTTFQFIGPDTGYVSYDTQVPACQHPGCPMNYFGYLASTIDEGAHWTAKQVPFKSPVIRFADSKTGWMVGDLGGAIFKTEDGGANWTSQSFPVLPSFHAIYTATPDKAWVVGQYGLILGTTNGGQPSNLIKAPAKSRTRTILQMVSSEIRFELASPEHVRASLYRVDGRTASVLIDKTMGPGSHVLPLKERHVGPGLFILDFRAGISRERKVVVAP